MLRSILVLVVCLAGVVLLSEPPAKPIRGPHQRPLMARKEVVQILGAPYKHLLADYYWIQTTHAAGVANSEPEYLDVYYFADMTTDLDPSFRYPYIFAGVTVPYNHGREHWTNTEQSTEILRKGVRQFPRDGYLRMLLAYNLSYFHKEYRAAAKELEFASKLPGAFPYLGNLATRLYAQSGDVDAGLELAATLASNAQDDETRGSFETRLKELKLEGALQRVEQAARLYHSREQRWPAGLHELVVSGDLPSIPEDPFGGHIYLDEHGQAAATSSERRLKMYDPLHQNVEEHGE